MAIDKRDQIGVRNANDVQPSPRDNNNVNHNNPESVAKEYEALDGLFPVWAE